MALNMSTTSPSAAAAAEGDLITSRPGPPTPDNAAEVDERLLPTTLPIEPPHAQSPGPLQTGLSHRHSPSVDPRGRHSPGALHGEPSYRRSPVQEANYRHSPTPDHPFRHLTHSLPSEAAHPPVKEETAQPPPGERPCTPPAPPQAVPPPEAPLEPPVPAEFPSVEIPYYASVYDQPCYTDLDSSRAYHREAGAAAYVSAPAPSGPYPQPYPALTAEYGYSAAQLGFLEPPLPPPGHYVQPQVALPAPVTSAGVTSGAVTSSVPVRHRRAAHTEDHASKGAAKNRGWRGSSMSEQDYKRTACDRERTRMRDMNKAFEALRERIPYCKPPGKKLSKIECLRLTIRYIRHLQNVMRMSEGLPVTQYDPPPYTTPTPWISSYTCTTTPTGVYTEPVSSFPVPAQSEAEYVGQSGATFSAPPEYWTGAYQPGY